ncbi:hypothetical protein LINGRAHAP2_LOCUS9595 [Linum grandiflorum]
MALVVKQQQKESENNYSISSSKGSAVKTSKKKNKRSMSVPGIGSLAFIESLSMPLVQEVVISADVQCAECQKRVADVISRMSGTESVTVNLVEKQVTLTCTYPAATGRTKAAAAVAAVYKNPLSGFAFIRRILGSS